MFNPRFPHKLWVEEAVFDEVTNRPVTDEEGNPVLRAKPLAVVVWNGEQPLVNADGTFVTELVDEINFGYRTSSKSTSDTVEVVTSDYKIATPMFITPLKPGDRVMITDYDRIYEGEVVKKTTFNLGSNIWYNEVRN